MVFFILTAIFINAGTPKTLPIGSIDPSLDQVADTNQSGINWTFGNITISGGDTNSLCEVLTGSAGLCDGSDATGTGFTAGGTINATNINISKQLLLGFEGGATECLQVDSNGIVTGTGSACGGSQSILTNNSDYNATNFYVSIIRPRLTNEIVLLGSVNISGTINFSLTQLSDFASIIKTSNLTTLNTLDVYVKSADFNLGNISNYTQYIQSKDFNLGNISNKTSPQPTFNATGADTVNATVFFNNTKIFNNGSGICIVKC